MDWFLYDRDFRRERIKFNFINSDMWPDFHLGYSWHYQASVMENFAK